MSEEQGGSLRSPVRKTAGTGRAQTGPISRSIVRTAAPVACDDCRAVNAFQAWHDIELTPSFNWEISFADYGIPPAGKKAVIELVTAQIIVPQGEWARLRMYTSLGTTASNLDLFLTFQGAASGQSIYVATHSIRAYSDGPISFDVNRDNAETSGYALICISGYLADA
jgi:hypothetical protein